MSSLNRILCVDDEPNVLEGLKRNLRRSFDVTTALGPQAGLHVLGNEGPFAAIVSDLSMPGMNGVAFFEETRKISPESARILLTGQADLNTAMAAVNQGAIFRFLLKPCAPDVLHQAIADGIEQYNKAVQRYATPSATFESARVLTPAGTAVEAHVGGGAASGGGDALMKFLVAFPSATTRRAIVNSLERIGYADVIETSNGEEALQNFGRSIRCVITAWEMPGMSGLEIARALRSLPDGLSVPIMMVTPRSSRSDILAAREAGISSYVAMPFTLQVLKDKVDAALRATR